MTKALNQFIFIIALAAIAFFGLLILDRLLANLSGGSSWVKGQAGQAGASAAKGAMGAIQQAVTGATQSLADFVASPGNSDKSDYGDADSTSLFRANSDWTNPLDNLIAPFSDDGAYIPNSDDIKNAGAAGTINGDSITNWLLNNRLF